MEFRNLGAFFSHSRNWYWSHFLNPLSFTVSLKCSRFQKRIVRNDPCRLGIVKARVASASIQMRAGAGTPVRNEINLTFTSKY